jgi:hypothetical protein
MALTRDDFRRGTLQYRGKLQERFYANGAEYFELATGDHFRRLDWHILPMTGFFPQVEVYTIDGRLLLAFPENMYYTYIEAVRVIKSQTVESFTGFEPDKLYKLQNGQTWQQMGGPYAPGHQSSGYVKIINNETMVVDTWEFYPRVVLIRDR